MEDYKPKGGTGNWKARRGFMTGQLSLSGKCFYSTFLGTYASFGVYFFAILKARLSIVRINSYILQIYSPNFCFCR